MRQQILCGLFFLICLSFHYVSSQCTLPTNDELVYLEYNNSSETFQPRKKAPFNSSSKFDDCDVNLQHNCCVCDDGEYYICLSLSSAIEYFLDAKQNNSNISQLYISIGQEEHHMVYTLDNIYKLNGFESIVLEGFGNSTIMCSNRSGLLIYHSCETYIESLTFTNCGLISPRHYGAVVLINNNNLYVSSVTFNNNEGTALYINFNRHNPNCLYKYYNITKSMFINNGIGTFKNLGGGIYMSIGEDVFASQITIKETHFYNNKADIGGGMYYHKNMKTSNEQCSSKMYMLDCVFFNNSATDHGGAMYYSGFSSIFERVSFTENIAGHVGGAIYQYLETPENPQNLCQGIVYKNCNWTNNKAEGSSALSILAPKGLLSRFPNDFIQLENNILEKNNATKFFFFDQTACTMYIENVPLQLVNVIVVDNYGTGLCLHSTYATFNSTNKFLNNEAYLGGAVYTYRSFFNISDDADIIFYNNAAVYGGSVYQDELPTSQTCWCLFKFQDLSNMSSTSAKVTFRNNRAISSGNSIYFLDPADNCLNETQHQEIHIIPNTTNQLSSEAYIIDFHNPILYEGSRYVLNVFLGQKIVLNVTILDYFNQTSFSQINLVLVPSGNRRQILFDVPYVLNAFQKLSIITGVNYPDLYVKGPKVNVSEGDNFYSLEIVSKHFTQMIELILKDCPLGFLYNPSEQSCLCVSDDKVKCNFYFAQACIKQGYWLGEVDNVHTTAPCTSDYCQNTNGNCSPCHIPDSSDYCLLPNDINGQCVGNRRGVLCAECEVGYAFTFGTIQCVEDKTCSKGQGVVPPLLNVVFLIVTMTAIILLLKFDYKLSSGYIFCFVYYFSIVGHLLPSNVVGDTLLGFVSIFESVTQLNPQFLGYVPICFLRTLTTLQRQVFFYFNPFVISTFVLAVIGFSKYCSKCSKYITFKDNTVIKAICLLLLLSFTAFAETSFNILNPVTFEGKVFVNIQPSTKYFNAKDHLPWFIIAILVEFLLVIPFTVLLLIAPLLTRCCNLNKIKPFLDEFQGCYKDNFRWMAGFYFLCRFMYLLILTYPSPNYVLLQYIIQLLSFSILVIHMLLQPYQNKWLNLSDSILLANITLITLLFGETAGVVFGSVPALRQIIVYFLIFVPVFCLIIVVVVTARKRCIRNKTRKTNNVKEPLVTHSVVAPSRCRSLSGSVGLREPMLSLLDSDELELRGCGVDTGHSRHHPVSYSILENPRLQDSFNSESRVCGQSRTRTTSSQDWQYEESKERDDL